MKRHGIGKTAAGRIVEHDTAPSESHRSDDGALVAAVATPRQPPPLDDAGEPTSPTTKAIGGSISFTRGGWPAQLRDLPPETVRGWSPERQTALRALNDCVEQFKNLSVATDEEGRHLTTKRGARQFSAQGKKDLMSAAMYCYLAFRVWLRAGNWVAGIKPENRALFSMK